MGFGGLSPFPRRLGGGPNALAAIVGSLNASMGDGYSQSPDSIAYLTNLTIARAIWAAWSTNRRLANQGNPEKTTTCLPRWERILALRVPPGDSGAARRRRLARHLLRVGRTFDLQAIEDVLRTEMPDVFAAVRTIGYDDALITVPDGTYPWGVDSTIAPWSSTVAHILVKVTKPALYSEGEFYDSVGDVHRTLDPVVPTDNTFDWYRNGPGHEGDGDWAEDDAAGFYLDDESNLDNQIFSV